MRKPFRFRFAFPLGGALVVGAAVAVGAALYPAAPSEIQFVVTSDAHYGITRATFRGEHHVDGHVVNAALVSQINTLSDIRLPMDGGVAAGRRLGAVDFVVETGDVTNRAEHTDELSVQSALASWSQFVTDYFDGIRLMGRNGEKAPVFVVPGNHEASNAVGFHRTMRPLTDVTPLVEIYNRMLTPRQLKTPATFDYARDRLFFSRDIGGIHFVFLHIWPDSVMRAQMERDLSSVSASTPVVIFTHDQPDVEAKHFVNPNGAHDINATDQFENLLADTFADGQTVDVASVIEQKQFEDFLGHHPNITAYFHGNSNWHQVYDWNGPTRSVRLHTFRVDSPMKGALSSLDETRLSFEVVTLDPAMRTLTVRECLWNPDPAHPLGPVAWGDTVTVSLAPRPARKASSSS